MSLLPPCIHRGKLLQESPVLMGKLQTDEIPAFAGMTIICHRILSSYLFTAEMMKTTERLL